MRNCLIGCIILLAMAGTAFSETKEPPKELAVDLGGGVKLDLVLIPAGFFTMGDDSNLIPASSFTMGDDSKKPAHKVTITKPFYLGKYEVTQEQWVAIMSRNPSEFKGSKNPVENVSWDDCRKFLAKLNAKAGGQGGKFLLPTEAQWEYACRAGSTGKFCFGDDEKQLGEYAWYESNSDGKTHPAGEKKPNAFGLYDMHGNVWEWCQDWYGAYGAEAVTDPSGLTTGSLRVFRGGSWFNDGGFFQSASRGNFTPGSRDDNLGFRVARVPADTVAETSPPDSVVLPKVQPISPGTTVQATDRDAVLPDQSKKPSEPPKKLAVDLGGGVKLDMTLIPAGEFKMGSGESAEDAAAFFNKTYGEDLLTADVFKDEHPQHLVQITKPFYLGTYHVTRGQFRQFVADSGYKTDAEKGEILGAWGWNPDKKVFDFNKKYSWRDASFEQTDEHPVVNASWNDAVAFCNWLSKKEGKTYRLPTEAEWEYACRAGSTTQYYSGDDPDTLATVGNVADVTAKAKFPHWTWAIKASDGYVFTSPVGKFRPNAFGLCDMHGNAWQWCSDWYGAEYYAASPADNPNGPDSGNVRVIRGGSWFYWPNYSRSASRNLFSPDFRFNFYTGFRVARTL